MKYYAIYEVTTGKFKQVGSCPEYVLAAQTPSDENLSLAELPEMSWDYYVDVAVMPHEAKAKTDHPLSIDKTGISALGDELATISGIHNPSIVTWPDGVVTEETGGTISFSLDLAGEYSVKIESIPYLTEVINVTATNPA